MRLAKLTKQENSRIKLLSQFYCYCSRTFQDFDHTSTKLDKDVWSAIPSDEDIINRLAILRKTFKNEHLSLVDVGSGKGNIVAAAAALGFDATIGIEFNEQYRNFTAVGYYIWGDALKTTKEQIKNILFNFSGAQKERTIFHIYQIFKNEDKLAKLYLHYYKLCNPGDIILITGDAVEEKTKLKISNTEDYYFRFIVKE